MWKKKLCIRKLRSGVWEFVNMFSARGGGKGLKKKKKGAGNCPKHVTKIW